MPLRRPVHPMLGVALSLFAAMATAAPPPARVQIDTAFGPIVIALETARAPITSANFLHYVDAGRFDGTTFYRAARSRSRAGTGLVQGGINNRIVKSFFPIAHEPNSRTGIKHVDGTVSMARNDPGTAMGDFFITVGSAPNLDAGPNYPGYAAFGHVVSGMGVVRRILAQPTYPGGYSEQTLGQSIRQRVPILRARRIPAK